MDYHLDRFVAAQRRDYAAALNEVRNGKKKTHWIWYIFPQVAGLGKSFPSQHYAIRSLDEAKAFLEHPYLGQNLQEICEALLQLDSSNAAEIFERDAKKLRSSMTLFACAAGETSVFARVLDKFFQGKYDYRTIKYLGLE